MKPILWIGSSLDDLKAFPDAARQRKVQHWKPIAAIGVGVAEIRIRGAAGAFRVIFIARFGNAVHVLHAFRKKSRKTPWQDVDLARKRFRSKLAA
jgi:phage-related protein